MNDPYRGTGRTTEQLRSSPPNAIFVWCNSQIGYPQDLCRALGRTDILVVPLGWYARGTSRPIVFDHFASASRRVA